LNLYTIGHSNHPFEKFLGLLEAQGIRTLVDIRSLPYSRYNPQFNQGRLSETLTESGIRYVYLGDSLGGRPKDPTCYRQQAIPEKAKDYLNQVDYTEVMKRPWFVEGIKQLLKIASENTTCILCSEWDPAQCHRHHLVAAYLLLKHPEVNVFHILRDGSLIEAKTIPATGDNNTTLPDSSQPA
jgi:uncharacterized protein (DUF488 family)